MNSNKIYRFSPSLKVIAPYYIIALLGFLFLYSYNSSDPSFSTLIQDWKTNQNALGLFGSWCADFFLQSFGLSSWLIVLAPFIFLTSDFWLFHSNPKIHNKKKSHKKFIFSFFFLLISSCIFLAFITFTEKVNFPQQGILGHFIFNTLTPLIGKTGCFLMACAFLTLSGRALFPFFIQSLFQKTNPLFFSENTKDQASSIPFSSEKPKLKLLTREPLNNDNDEPKKTPIFSELIKRKQVDDKELKIDHVIEEPSPKEKINQDSKELRIPQNWELPDLNLLKKSQGDAKGPSDDELMQTAKKISETLNSFDIKGQIVEILPGPIITVFEFKPEAGIRIQKILGSSADLAMTLGAPSVRIVAPVPGKSVAAIEVPNNSKLDVLLRDVYEETNSRAEKMKLPITIGKDTEGKSVIEDLAKMPHLLIGGATSMGKSVFVNSILTSLLCRFTPDELKLIIVDPKLVEFKIFEKLPHLLLPIVNDADDANQALKWAVAETQKRYKILQKIGAKNIVSFNEKIDELSEQEYQELKTDLKLEENNPLKMSYIVIIIDELAELMLTAKKEVEQSIVRLTQLARAAGIHLIMATQRPSADVVTGLIKSNCPSRASLRVASSSDSRIILDCTGAEQLIGQGDLFFTSAGPMGLKRIQGPFVSDQEIEDICDAWRAQGDPLFRDEILKPVSIPSETPENVDSLYEDILQFAKDKGAISTSLIQRRFQVGYTRAARIMENFEDQGIISDTIVAGKPREVLVS